MYINVSFSGVTSSYKVFHFVMLQKLYLSGVTNDLTTVNIYKMLHKLNVLFVTCSGINYYYYYYYYNLVIFFIPFSSTKVHINLLNWSCLWHVLTAIQKKVCHVLICVLYLCVFLAFLAIIFSGI